VYGGLWMMEDGARVMGGRLWQMCGRWGGCGCAGMKEGEKGMVFEGVEGVRGHESERMG
jgi:hypothetical protein